MALDLTRKIATRVGAALLCAAPLVVPSAALAQGAVPASSCTTFADGLTNPKFLTLAADGTVYVAEAGIGGSEEVAGAAGLTRGPSGQVTRISAAGQKSVLVAGLTSYGAGTGPAGIALAGGSLWVTVGGPGPQTPVVPQAVRAQHEGRLLRVNPQTGAVTAVADIGGYERTNNPDGNTVDTNLQGVAVAADGSLLVSDAGGNALYRVNPVSGQLSVVAAFPGLPGPGPNPNRDGRAELDPVPTGVAIGPDGAIYVGHLSGAPFPQGAAKVVRVSSDGRVSDAAGGMTAVTGVTVGPDRLLYVTESFARFDPAAMPPPFAQPSRVLRVLADGRTQVAVDGLNFPYGTAFDRGGNLYVVVGANNGPGQGQVLRCARVAVPARGLPATGGGSDHDSPGGGGDLPVAY